MSDQHADLLRRHQPKLRYDSSESYFADSAAEWTDHDGNRLMRGDQVLATAGAGEDASLSLAFLGGDYPDGEEAEGSDRIVCADKEYVADAARLHRQSAYRNKMYGRAVREPGHGALWLQYWFFYFYNDYNLIGPLIKAGLHEGDWEMVQLRIGADESPDLAVYAQHTHAEVRGWDDVERPGSGERPVVYVARGSHASYFSPGVHWTGYWFDHADGRRKSPETELLEIDAGAPGWGWVRWPGRWGGTTGGPSPLDDASPTAPIEHDQWHDPRALLPKAEEKERLRAASTSPVLPSLASVAVRRTPVGLDIDYVAKPVGDEALLGIAVSINSVDEASVPPSTYTVPATTLTGTASLPVPLAPENRYDVNVSAAFSPHLATEAIDVDLPAENH